MRRLLCWLLGHGPWQLHATGWLIEDEVRRARVCGYCGKLVALPEVDG